MITVVLCIAIVRMRRCHRKADNKVTCNTTKLNTDVTIDDNPSYDVTKANTVDISYNTIKPQGSDVPITSNPLYLKIYPDSDHTTENTEYGVVNQPTS